jgi:serine/threonine-protein kinase
MNIQNPYSDRTALTSADTFFGRTKELSDAYNRLFDGMSVALVGERRMGKSSVLSALRFPEFRSAFGVPDNWCFAYMDAQSIGHCTEEELINHLLRRMKRTCDQVTWHHPSREALRGAFELLHGYTQRLIILIDEFDLLTTNPDIRPDFFGVLRSISAEFEVPFVVAFKESNLDNLVSAEDVGSAFLNTFVSLFVGPFQPEESRQLVITPAARLGIEFSNAEVERVLDLSGYFPFFIQIACYYLFDAKQRGLSVDLETLDERFIVDATQHFRYLTSCLTAREKAALKAFMTGATPDSRGLEQLMLKGILIREQNGTVRMFSSIYGEAIEDLLIGIVEKGRNSGASTLFKAAKARLLE